MFGQSNNEGLWDKSATRPVMNQSRFLLRLTAAGRKLSRVPLVPVEVRLVEQPDLEDLVAQDRQLIFEKFAAQMRSPDNCHVAILPSCQLNLNIMFCETFKC